MKHRWLKWLGLAVGMTLLGGVVGWQFYDPGWRYEVRGIDVSHHQGSVDWDEIAAAGTDFAYIKATEGGDWTDTRFGENWVRASQTEVLRGAYHFFTFCTPGLDQAEHMIATVPNEPGALPPAVDLEYSGNCSKRPTVAEFRAELDPFLEVIKAHYDVRPVIYTNADFYDTYLAADPPDVTWWMLSPVAPPWGSPEWTFWQYLPGQKPGVEGAVDRDVFHGTPEQLRSLLTG